MNIDSASPVQSAAEWRREFDHSFSMPAGGERKDRESLIAIRAGGEALAFRTGDITGLAKGPRITPLPSTSPALAGILAVRGVLFPVWDLAALLGLEARAKERGWAMFAKCETQVALVFDQFEGQAQIERTALNAVDAAGSRQYVQHIANVSGIQRAVIDIAGLVEEIRKQASMAEVAKE